MQNHTRCGWSLVLAALFSTFASLTAAEPLKKTGELPELVISATKNETERWRTATSITVIDREKIEKDQLRLLPDALRQVPGLIIADRGTTGSVNGIFLRLDGNPTRFSIEFRYPFF